MQYGLFLKGIGLSLEQALQFWRSEFVRGKVDADKVTSTNRHFPVGLQYQLTKLAKQNDLLPMRSTKEHLLSDLLSVNLFKCVIEK